MKKTILLAFVVVVLVVGGAVLLFHKNSPSTNMSDMSGSTSSNSKAVATSKVTISNFSFTPSAITVKKGTTVTWTNSDSVAHTVVETDGKAGPNSQSIDNGKSYSFTYNTVGTFAYHCSIHPDMTGTVTVTD